VGELKVFDLIAPAAKLRPDVVDMRAECIPQHASADAASLTVARDNGHDNRLTLAVAMALRPPLVGPLPSGNPRRQLLR
jgi:hypothetical protein